jgi:hypothetical protein
MSAPKGFDIMSIFNPNAAPALPPNTQQHAPVPDPAFQKNDSQDPKNNEPAKIETPLDKHKDLFKVDEKKDDGKPDPNAPLFNIDPAKMKDEVAKINFVQHPEMAEKVQAAMKGDASAMLEVINFAAQQSFMRAAQLSASTSERAARTVQERMQQELPNHVRRISSAEALSEVNPVFDHPAMKPMVDAVRAQFESKFPDAAPREIAKMVNGYLGDVSTQLTQKKDPTTDHRKVDGSNDDFVDFFGQGFSR